MDDYFKKFKKDIRDIYEFYVDDDTRIRLDSMGRLRKFLHRFYHIAKNFYSKLYPIRKIVLIIALFFLFTGNDSNGNGKLIISAYLFLFLLLLELKDKLLARRELEAGRVVQEALIPRNIPTISGWDVWFYSKPAHDVGGDLVDYLKINEHKYIFALADISGKGLGAALLMSKLQATLRAVASAHKSLTKIAMEVNKIFYRDVTRKNFATLILVELDTKHNQLNYINAGHLPPLKIAGKNISEEKKGSPAIGLSAETSYNLKNVTLNKNEIFLTYSDGITEAMRQDGIFFGDQNFYTILRRHQAISMEKLGDKIVKGVREFLGEADQTDDLSLLIIKKE